MREALNGFKRGRKIGSYHRRAGAIDRQATAGTRSLKRERGDDKRASALYAIRSQSCIGNSSRHIRQEMISGPIMPNVNG